MGAGRSPEDRRAFWHNLTNTLSLADIGTKQQRVEVFNIMKMLLYGRCTISYGCVMTDIGYDKGSIAVARQRAVKCVERALSMLNFLMTKLTTKALPEIPVIIMKTYRNPFM